MEEKRVVDFFEKFLSKDSIFKSKQCLQSNYYPTKIEHRDDQIDQIASMFAPSLRSEKPSNIFIYGKTGTGKTLTVKYVSDQLKKMAEERELPLKIVYVNCKLKKISDTEYRLIAQLAREFNKSIPPTGLPTEEVYNIFYKAIDSKEQVIILILDEIDQLLGKVGDELLYNLTRINSELKNAQISIVGISNDLLFTEQLDPRVKSSMSEEEIIFPPYNAIQIKSILEQRSKDAIKDEALEQGLLEKCAAYAAREHGDARRALELLRVAAELAERSGEDKVKISYLDKAEQKIEKDRVIDIVKTQPKQYQLILYAVFHVCKNKNKHIFTGEVYDAYQQLCKHVLLRPLTQRRVSDIIAEFDMLGIIQAKVISKGRYGRTREIRLMQNTKLNEKVLGTLKEELSV